MLLRILRNLSHICHVGVSENSVPLNPMVNDHYPVFKWLFHWEYTLFSDKPMSSSFSSQSLSAFQQCRQVFQAEVLHQNLGSRATDRRAVLAVFNVGRE